MREQKVARNQFIHELNFARTKMSGSFTFHTERYFVIIRFCATFCSQRPPYLGKKLHKVLGFKNSIALV